MDMKISRKDIKLLLYAGGILFLIVIYFVFYRNITQKSDEMEGRVRILEQEKNQLEALNDKKAEYEEETTDMQQQIETVLAGFPADVREENAIVYAEELENLSGMEISGITIGSKNLLYSTGQNIEENAQDAENTADIENTADSATNQIPSFYLYGMPINYSFTVDYSSFKKAAALISENAEKRNMETLTLSFDNETGKLVGTATVNMYFMLGGDGVYQKPEVSFIKQGVDDIFGTVGGAGSKDTE